MKMETWYLTQNPDQTIRKLSELIGWKRQIATVLISKSQGDEHVADEIRSLLPARGREQEQETITTILELLSKQVRSRAKVFLSHLLAKASVDDSGQLVLPDGAITSPVIDVVKYYVSPASHRVPPPTGVQRINKFLKDINMPRAAMIPDNRLSTAAKQGYQSNNWITV